MLSVPKLIIIMLYTQFTGWKGGLWRSWKSEKKTRRGGYCLYHDWKALNFLCYDECKLQFYLSLELCRKVKEQEKKAKGEEEKGVMIEDRTDIGTSIERYAFCDS